MKKIFLAFLSLVILLLTSCDNLTTQSKQVDNDNKSTTESKEVETNKRYEIDLTMENYWKFFSNTKIEYTNGGETAKITYSNQGILDYAYYENVIFTLEISYQYKNLGVWPYAEAHGKLDTVTLETKANGYGTYTHDYSQYQSIFKELPSYNGLYITCILNVVGVSGKVIFTM